MRKGLIKPDARTFAGEDGFRFGHILIRDAAYDSMPKRLRAELHERFAAWAEGHAGEGAELDEIVGHHLEQAYGFRIGLGACRRARGLACEPGRRPAAARGSPCAGPRRRPRREGAAGARLEPAGRGGRPADGAGCGARARAHRHGRPQRRRGGPQRVDRTGRGARARAPRRADRARCSPPAQRPEGRLGGGSPARRGGAAGARSRAAARPPQPSRPRPRLVPDRTRAWSLVGPRRARRGGAPARARPRRGGG